MTYDTFADAAAAVDRLRKAGMWPGIRCHADGTYAVSLSPVPEEEP